FLAPLLLAVALLLLEAGIVAHSGRMQVAALMIPAVSLMLSFPFQNGSTPYVDFLRRFVAAVGAPFLLPAIARGLFYSLSFPPPAGGGGGTPSRPSGPCC